jgi:hypothetical protein
MALGVLAGCGGGGGGGAPPPPAPVNQAPTFTSGASAAVVENSGGTIYRAAATDPEGAAVAFSIVGGADAARFNIAPNGELLFVAPPNFDLPTDSDQNNVYLVEIGASDGQNQSRQTVTVTVSNSKEGVFVRRIGTGFVNPVAMSPVSDTHLLVAEKNGAIYAFNLQNGSRTLLAQIPSVSGQGVLSIAAANDFVGSGSFFVMYMNAGSIVVQQYLRNPLPNGPTVPNAFGPVLTIPASDYAGGGWVGFDFSGRLLIATGDAGGTGDPTGSAQNDSSRLGKIILAEQNPDPFAGASPVFYLFTTVAKGLHQPVGGFAYNFGSNTVGLLIGDRGQAVADEVDFFAQGASGINFGWPFKEGFRIVQGTPPGGVVDPLTEYLRPGGAGVQGIVGGAIGGSIPVPALDKTYVFADRSGAIFSFPISSLQNARTTTERRTADFAPDVGAIDQPAGIVADYLGRLYILDGDGEIFRVDAG